MDNTDFYWDDIWEEMHNPSPSFIVDLQNVAQEVLEQCDHNCENCWCVCEKEEI